MSLWSWLSVHLCAYLCVYVNNCFNIHIKWKFDNSLFVVLNAWERDEWTKSTRWDSFRNSIACTINWHLFSTGVFFFLFFVGLSLSISLIQCMDLYLLTTRDFNLKPQDVLYFLYSIFIPHSQIKNIKSKSNWWIRSIYRKSNSHIQPWASFYIQQIKKSREKQTNLTCAQFINRIAIIIAY